MHFSGYMQACLLMSEVLFSYHEEWLQFASFSQVHTIVLVIFKIILDFFPYTLTFPI